MRLEKDVHHYLAGKYQAYHLEFGIIKGPTLRIMMTRTKLQFLRGQHLKRLNTSCF